MMSIEAQQLMRKSEERGEKRGEKKKATSIAKKLLSQGLTREQISAATDLSIEEIKKIDAERK